MINFLDIYKQEYSNWDELENVIEKISVEKTKGDAFEQFCYVYFLYFANKYQIKEVYLFNNIPEEYKNKYRLEPTDYGVDLLIIDNSNNSIAIQAKFRTYGIPSYSNLSTFWAESEYCDKRCIFSNTFDLPRQSEKKKNQFVILKDSLVDLPREFFVFLHKCTNSEEINVYHTKYKPMPYQEQMINDVIHGFENEDRGKLIAACGTGKTLMSLWIKEKIESVKTLYVAPSIALVKQTLDSWSEQSNKNYKYICICSDNTVYENNNDDDIGNGYIDVPVTTSSEYAKAFLNETANENIIVFSTYQSLDVVSNALTNMENFSFNLAIFDEAHRTAGNSNSQMFTLGLNDEFIKCDKRLFMTATERVVSFRIKNDVSKYNYKIYSMDDTDIYGQTFSSMSFRKAINENIISDYRIILVGIKDHEVLNSISNRTITSIDGTITNYDTLFKQTVLSKVISKTPCHKIISYHDNVKNAKAFISNDNIKLDNIISNNSYDIDENDIYCSHINGSMPASDRKRILYQFSNYPYGVISNVRCLTEGVDSPSIDGVFFSEPKNSTIDIVQAVGRALRKDKNNPNKISYIIIPLEIPDNVTSFDEIDPKNFETLHSVIQALRDQDENLSEEIDSLNLRLSMGRHGGSSLPKSILIDIPSDIDYNNFSNSITLKIAEINKNPSKINHILISEENDRTSGIKRSFVTVGDYNLESLYQEIINTANKFGNLPIGLERNKISIDHNNVSHCKRIGVINKIEDKFYLTEIGRAFSRCNNDYNDIYKKQLLKYYIKEVNMAPFFPYRKLLKVLLNTKYITKLEFIYSLYITNNSSEESISESIRRILYLRETYPNINILNKANKEKVLKILNVKYSTGASFEDVWTTRTTVSNQWGYIRNHLTVWNNLIVCDIDKISLIENCEDKLRVELNNTEYIENLTEDNLQIALISN